MAATQTHVIVGASLAGAKAAEALRTAGFDGRIVLVGAELHRPYERPPLSKQVLRGEADPSTAYVHDEAFYDDHDIELRLGTRATGIDVGAQRVQLEGGPDLRYDRLLLATGARPRRLHLPGADLDGICCLRDLGDVEALQQGARPGARVAVVGAGWIGSEVAASLRQMGAEVALVAPEPVPLQRVLGDEIGAIYRDLHADHGVELHLGVGVEGFVGNRRVAGVRTDDGRVIEADLVVVGVGVRPRTELAEAAGLAVDDGIVVDEHLTTSAAEVCAAGDVAAAWHPRLGGRIRVEHWANARHQGAHAARTMLGDPQPYDRVPYFFSDQYDVGMEYSGYAPEWDRVVVRGDREARQLVAFWIRGNRVAAAMNMNVWDVAEPLQALIAAGRPIPDAVLADPDVPITDLVAAGAPS